MGIDHLEQGVAEQHFDGFEGGLAGGCLPGRDPGPLCPGLVETQLEVIAEAPRHPSTLPRRACLPEPAFALPSPVLTRLGPAPVPLLCAVLVVAIAAFGALVPIGRPSRTLEPVVAYGMLLGAGALGAWAVALGISAWGLSRVEGAAAVLVPAMSPGVFDLLFSLPFLVLVPVAGGGLFTMLRGGGLSLAGLLCAGFTLGLCALRETDGQLYVAGGRVVSRQGWLWVRTTTVETGRVHAVDVVRDSYRGAPSYVVKLSFHEPGRYPALEARERRFRDEAEAQAEAARWKEAIGQLQGGP